MFHLSTPWRFSRNSFRKKGILFYRIPKQMSYLGISDKNIFFKTQGHSIVCNSRT